MQVVTACFSFNFKELNLTQKLSKFLCLMEGMYTWKLKYESATVLLDI